MDMSSVLARLAALEAKQACSTQGVYAPFEVPASGKCPVLHYDMQTMASTTAVADLINGDTNLEIQGSPTAGKPGRIGTTYELNGCGDFFYSPVEEPYPSRLNGASAKSLSAWAYLTSLEGDGDKALPLASFGDNSGGCSGESFAMTPTSAVGCGNDVSGSEAAVTGEWRHYATAYDGSTWNFYVNGAKVGTKTTTLGTGTTDSRVAVGSETWHGTSQHRLCKGMVDEVKIYDYALSAAQVGALYALS